MLEKLKKFSGHTKKNFPDISHFFLPWIPEPSTANNKLKRREGSGSTGRFFD
jgi:hypothetical protein